ncbi:LacI family transcriptional regulator [Dictyobacter alpinus]|uniref:LacI family transcriptional regulator n=1 Tax=Dictyobacter alpinus TaxID=2014873 RepID=A0A402BGE1_9CHLR|nr:LacI family DNA-binding transcriptional regulator [Dictyobacter alpinus]GCE30305.1 LacI family transcriptional regulator [Dictyobacter alpinus]GCE30337.1 LacI family transcriptional regulator [Dictyobacter alpinus]
MIGSVTVKDVARKADVSVGTVSRVFNNHSNVSEEIRDRVLKAATELGYERIVSAEPPRTGGRQIKEIGFLYGDLADSGATTSNPFWTHILNGVEHEARRSNIKVTYRSIMELVQTPQELFSTVQDMKLGGILLVGPAEQETVQVLKSLDIPLVLVDNHIPGLSVNSVLCDNFEGAYMAVNYLIERGHRKIAFIGGPVIQGFRPIDVIYTIQRRSLGYRTALLDAGIQINTNLMEHGNLKIDGGYQACQRLIEQQEPFTALFCANDELAIGAMKALRQYGRRLPEDVSVIGFDDIALVEHLTPALTTIRVNKEAIGEVAVKRLLEQSNDSSDTSISSILEVDLIERASVFRIE